MSKRKFKEGMRIRLLPFEDNPEERGVIIAEEEGNDMWVVCVDEVYREDIHDDGLRELSSDQMEPL